MHHGHAGEHVHDLAFPGEPFVAADSLSPDDSAAHMRIPEALVHRCSGHPASLAA